MALRASLPMYDLPEAREWTDRLWIAIAEELREDGVAGVPDALERLPDHHAAWRPDGLLLSQSCGYPVATALHRALRVVATPHYAAPGCDVHHYASAVVVRTPSRAANPGCAARRRMRIQLAGLPVRVQRAQSGRRADRGTRAVLRTDGRDRRPRGEYRGGAERTRRRLRGRLRDVGVARSSSTVGVGRAQGTCDDGAGAGAAPRYRR